MSVIATLSIGSTMEKVSAAEKKNSRVSHVSYLENFSKQS
jgi:hypothetical protein